MYESLDRFSLRKINYVKTRTTILKTCAQLLKEKTFATITVDEICQKAQISRGTFFNYFPTKEHIFHYFIKIFTVKVALGINKWSDDMKFTDKINKIYQTCVEEKEYTDFLGSYINFLLTVGEENNEMTLIDAEFAYFFKEINEIDFERYNNLTLGDLLGEICEEAKRKGEITMTGSKKELSAMAIGVITGAYISDGIMPGKEHLSVLNGIWKM